MTLERPLFELYDCDLLEKMSRSSLKEDSQEGYDGEARGTLGTKTDKYAACGDGWKSFPPPWAMPLQSYQQHTHSRKSYLKSLDLIRPVLQSY